MLQSLNSQLGDDGLHEITLKSENFLVFPLMPFGPNMGGAGDIDKLGVDANTVAGLLNAALQSIANIQLLPDLFYIHCLALIEKNGVAGDNQQIIVTRQIGNDVVGNAVAEILLLGITAKILERQNGNGSLVVNFIS